MNPYRPAPAQPRLPRSPRLAAVAGWASRHPEAAMFLLAGAFVILVVFVGFWHLTRTGIASRCYTAPEFGGSHPRVTPWVRVPCGDDRRLVVAEDVDGALDVAKKLGCEVRP